MRLALFQPDIAQNLGTSLRTCACLGVAVDVIEPCGFPFDDRKFRRAGMDYIDQVDYRRHISWQHFYDTTTREGGRIVLLSTKGAVPYTEFHFLKNDVLLLGRESAGVPAEVAAACQHSVTITMQEGCRSLNVAIAGAMILGEALRQIR